MRLFASIAAGLVMIPSAIAEGPVFEADILPILTRSCIHCHGPEKQSSGYRLDVRSVALRGGNSGRPAIVPHDADASQLIQYVSGANDHIVMPPADSGIDPLSTEEIATLSAWIDQGPAWPDAFAGSEDDAEPHWSLQPLVMPEVPADAGHPVDAFIHETLAEQRIDPSPEADRRTLMRRVYYDLTGLPPTPEELESFIADPDPKAYDKLVDKLLASPRYGERWARHWLDTIHFADSHGFEHDIARDHAWRYRDYVIESLNNDKPWATFIKEQLAADHFYPEKTQLTPALGFLGAGTFDLSTYITSTTTFDYLDRDDLVTQTAAAFLGTTANCARCHTHKFDPISQQDYYALQAVFSGVLKGDVAYDPDPEVAQHRKYLNDTLAAIDRRDADTLLTPGNDQRIHEWLNEYGSGPFWTAIDLQTFSAAHGTELSANGDGVFTAGGPRPDKEVYTITATSPLETVTAIRLEVFASDNLPSGGPGRNDNGNFHLSEFEVEVFEPGASQPTRIDFAKAEADFDQEGWVAAHAIDGNEGSSWGIYPEVAKSHHITFTPSEPLTLTPHTRIAVVIKQVHGGMHMIGKFRISVVNGAPDTPVVFSSNATKDINAPAESRSVDQRLAIATAILRHEAAKKLEALPDQAVVYAAAPSVDIPNGEPAAKLASLEKPKTVHRMIRGEFDKPAEIVGPGALSALTHAPARFAIDESSPEPARRAALAEWIAHPDNVLTWRCIVNRVWHYHFGRGLCDTPSDLGEMGGTPSHPELIDWLAVWFRDEVKGSLKELHKLIVTSETYKQSSAHRDAAAEIDTDNRYLWRQNVHRIDADSFRDFTLAVSGRLNLTMGGPGDRYFTEGKGPQITPALDYDAYDWTAAELSRRSIYRFVWRGIADPFMEALDFPDLGLLSPKRAFSASSLQALTLYNNEFVLAHSQALTRRVASEADTTEKQIERAVQLVWLRDLTDSERESMAEFVRRNDMAALCRVLLNSNEYLFID